MYNEKLSEIYPHLGTYYVEFRIRFNSYVPFQLSIILEIAKLIDKLIMLFCNLIYFSNPFAIEMKWPGWFQIRNKIADIYFSVHLINDHGFWIWTNYLSYLDRKVGSWHALFDCTNWFHFDLFWCGSKASKMGLEILWSLIWVHEKYLKSISEVILILKNGS